MPQTAVTENLWNIVRQALLQQLPKDIFETWFSELRPVVDGQDTLILGAPNEFAAIWLQDNYLDLIREHVGKATERPMSVVIECHASSDTPVPEGGTASSQTGGREVAVGGGRSRMAESRVAQRQPLLINPKNTFENYIVGASNQLAHAASMAVAHSPGVAYNPLFLYGDTGLGKTHLMHAIAHTVRRERPDAHVVYASCEKFTNEFMRAIQESSLPKFRKFYRGVDILLIDDVQFLEGKERTQEEFFHTFNELFESGRQICLSSDRPAGEITRLESRLISRFQWGMMTDIQPPDLETRLAILQRKAISLKVTIPEDILQFLAERITRNVRRMEGALIKVATNASLLNRSPDMETTERLVHDILEEETSNQVTIEKIQKEVVQFYALRMADMVSRRRPNNIAFPRQIAMYLARLLTNHPLKEIGDGFGGRDHGTVIHACKCVENMMEQDESIKRTIDYLRKKILNKS